MASVLQQVFEFLPIVLACVATITCSIRYGEDRRKSFRFAMILSVFTAVLLIIAQTSWWVSYQVQGSLEGTVFSNYIWTIFNSLAMLTLITASMPFRNKK